MQVSWNVYLDPASQKDLGLLLSLSHRHFNHMVLTFVTQSTLLPSTITHPIALKSLPFFQSRWLTLLPAPWGPLLIPWSQNQLLSPNPLHPWTFPITLSHGQMLVQGV